MNEEEQEYDYNASNGFGVPSPENGVDLSWKFTNSVWGKDEEVPEGFKQFVSEEVIYKDPLTNKLSKVTKNNWNSLGFFTRDFRLSNLDKFEVEYCEHYSNLASEWINEGFMQPFTVALSKVASKLELNQSKKGFFRKQTNTVTNVRENKFSETVNSNNGLFHKKNVKG